MARVENFAAAAPGAAMGRARRRPFSSLAGRTVLLTLGLGSILALACSLVPAQSSAPVVPTPAGAEWIEIVRPIPLYALVGTDFAKLPMTYSAERSSSGERRDLLAFGTLGSDTPSLQLSFARRGDRDGPILSFDATLDRIVAAGRTSVVHLASPTTLDTRFGRFDVADLRLDDGLRSTFCLGFRGTPDPGNVVGIAGVACGTRARAIGRDQLACIVDRIDLVSAGSDTALKTVFVQAERRRGRGCAPLPQVAAGVARTTWLDANAPPPPMRGLSAEAARR